MRIIRSVRALVTAVCIGFGQFALASGAGDCGADCVRIRMAGRLLTVPVTVANVGTYAFLLDTGSASTIIDSALAETLRLPVAGRTPLETTSGSTDASLTRASLRFGAIYAENLEILQMPLGALQQLDARVQGVLGQDVLRRSNWLLDNRRGVIEQDQDGSVAAVTTGHRLAIRWAGGRPTVEATFGQRAPTDLVLDSAATEIVLFGSPLPRIGSGSMMHLRSLDAEMDVPVVIADMLRLGPLMVHRPRAALVPRESFDGGGGLLPTSIFEMAYFDSVANAVVVTMPGDPLKPVRGRD